MSHNKEKKQPNAFRNYAHIYVDILNSFNPELQFKNTESAKKHKLKN